MLTARDDEFDTVLGLELGADDYITKPFSIREFRSRVRALLRRAAPRGGRSGERAPRGGPVTLDTDRREARVDGRALDLTYVEFELLRTLVAQPGGSQPAGSAAGDLGRLLLP